MSSASLSVQQYRQVFGGPDRDLLKAFRIAGPIGLVVLILGLVIPKQTPEMVTVEEVPDRFAKLILEEPKVEPAPVAVPEPPKVATIEKPPTPLEKPKPKVVEPVRKDAGQRRTQPKKVVPEDRGQAGRELAKKEVTQQLASVTSSLENVLTDVSSSLASTDDGAPKKKVRTNRRKTRGGRTATQLASVGTAVPTIDAPAAGSSAITGSQIEIASTEGALVSESWVPDANSANGQAATNQSLRSDRSLLSVVRKYSAGIQFCYDNELKKAPGLGGKLVVSITVAASGRVTGANVVRDTVGSAALQKCALTQIEAWKFPAIEAGVVTFQAPFVFTPPE